MKKPKPYQVNQDDSSGKFLATGDEPIDSPVIGLRMPKALYDKVVAIAGKDKSVWIRQAIREKLERDEQRQQN
ncbi:hypothetical protein [Nostoc sp. 2RC]|uniref:hypothetical protein n=1 Tax=Nostoc sp. 2RC TaxID=2485484 RepID=UPI0016256BD3|nr:hypothetical protein [Nostoc sp. 2RC]MBC1237569.1 hypothetical protein [Nostoc sp. 2RC]